MAHEFQSNLMPCSYNNHQETLSAWSPHTCNDIIAKGCKAIATVYDYSHFKYNYVATMYTYSVFHILYSN